jgi:nitroreductase
MELMEAMRTVGNCRYYLPDAVPDAVFYRAIEAARFAPQGGNRQPVRFVIVRDREKKRQLGDWYLALWREVATAVREGRLDLQAASGTTKSTRLGFSNPAQALADGDHFAAQWEDHPAIIVVCVDLAETHPTDTDLDRLSIVSGASVYPMVQNLCLALRDQGVATTFTTLLVAYEPQVKELLGIPEQLSTACHLAAGYPAKGFPKKLRRLPVEELAFVETYGAALATRG